MSDLEKDRAQRDAQRSAARRSRGSIASDQAIIRHLGVEFYRERQHTERRTEKPVRTDADQSDDQNKTDGSADQ
jgi:hypothetical protein